MGQTIPQFRTNQTDEDCRPAVENIFEDNKTIYIMESASNDVINETMEQNDKADADVADCACEIPDKLPSMMPIEKKGCKLAKMRAPSFEGYFASGTRSYAFNSAGVKLNPTIENKIGEIQAHLEHIISLLREIDMLRMAVRVESRYPQKKRYLTVVQSDKYHSAIIGIDWQNDGCPTVGLVLPIWNATESKLDGDGGLHISRSSTRNHVFKPVSVQTLWSAKQVIDKGIDYASKRKYFEGMPTDGFIEFYEKLLSSDSKSMAEWNEMGDQYASHIYEVLSEPDSDAAVEAFKDIIRNQLREVMRKVDLDEVTCKQILVMCEENLGMDLSAYKKFVNEEMLVVMGQMDSASRILDYLYLGSEWNASSLHDLKDLGIGFILNITREVDNFFPQTFSYYNIRVYDEEETELLKHWDHTYRFIEKARKSGSKVLVHCRYGISRSASTVIAYLMKKMGWGMIETLDYVKSIRTIVEPNQGFQKQLIVYEGILNSSRNRYSSLFDRPPPEPNDLHKAAMEKKKQMDEVQKNQRNLEISEKIIMDEEKNTDVDDHLNNTDETDGNPPVTVSITSPTEEKPRGGDLSLDTSADLSFSEDELNMSRSPTTGKRRIFRAKTMCSGAVLIDEEGEGDSSQKDGRDGEERPTSEIIDPDEDRVMQQAVKATQMKNELMGSIKELNTCEDSNRTVEENLPNEDTIKPSILRRISLFQKNT